MFRVSVKLIFEINANDLYMHQSFRKFFFSYVSIVICELVHEQFQPYCGILFLKKGQLKC